MLYLNDIDRRYRRYPCVQNECDWGMAKFMFAVRVGQRDELLDVEHAISPNNLYLNLKPRLPPT